MCDLHVSNTSLGIVAKSLYAGSPAPDRSSRRRERYRLQEFAGRLLPEGHRSARCGRRLASGRSGVRVVVSTAEDGERRASYHNVETCANVWACPVCSARISEGRRQELNALLKWARDRHYGVRLMTLTLRHGAGEGLAGVLEVLKDAKTRFHNSRAWRSAVSDGHIIGHVTATEVTHGEHGWHPHLHVLLIMRADAGHWAILDGLRPAWERALQAAGGYGNGFAFQVQDASSAGEYVSKWGAASEMTLSGHKGGRAGSRGVWQLLADAGAGDIGARLLWLEYVNAFAGKRQLVWSRKLKAEVGIGERDDSEVLEDIEIAEETAAVDVLEIGPNLWSEVLFAGVRAQVLDIAEMDIDSCAEFLANLGLQAGLESIEVQFV